MSRIGLILVLFVVLLVGTIPPVTAAVQYSASINSQNLFEDATAARAESFGAQFTPSNRYYTGYIGDMLLRGLDLGLETGRENPDLPYIPIEEPIPVRAYCYNVTSNEVYSMTIDGYYSPLYFRHKYTPHVTLTPRNW
jgi:hypothetical protein